MTRPNTLPISKRGLNFEMLMWFFTRISALVLYALLLIGLIGALVMGARTQMNFADVIRWSFMPNLTHVQSTDVPDLTPWSTPFWRLMASFMVFTAAAHGLHGLLSVLDDYFVKPRVRNTFRVLITIILPVMSVIGIYVIWTS